MSTSFKAKLVRSFAITTLGLAATAQTVSADCPGQVFYRLWQPGGAETWYDAGEQIDIASGQEGHIYVHVRGRGDNRYGTSARIGYPGEFGLGGDAQEVPQHAQSRVAALLGMELRAEHEAPLDDAWKRNTMLGRRDGRVAGGCDVRMREVRL